MTKTPSTELHAVKPEPPNGNDGTPANRTSDPDKQPEPPWVEELRRLLQDQGKQLDDQGERIAAIEKRLQHLDGSLGVLANSYKVQSQELQLLRQACPSCDAEAIITSEG